MSEKATAKPAEKEAKKDVKSEVVKAKDQQAKREKQEWTLEKCMKYARRSTSEALWASTSPASYKSAVAHGWRDQCLAEIEKAKSGKVVTGNFNSAGKSDPNRKKAA